MQQRTVEANGLEFGILEAGEGPLALCLHGFPDTAHTWRHLLPSLAEAGFHAVAPFTRGFAPTSVPEDSVYSMGALIADATALHEAFEGDEQAVLIGHDWGAATSYGAAAFAPERWRRVVGISVPPFSLNPRMFGDYAQLQRFFYFFFFGTGLAEPVVADDDMAFVERLWRDWSPGYDPTDDLPLVKAAIGASENLSAAVGYYRAVLTGFLGAPGGSPDPYEAESAAMGAMCKQPTLYVHGDGDGCIALELVADAEEHLPDESEMEVIAGSGHFCHLEKPDQVAKLVLDWIRQ